MDRIFICWRGHITASPSGNTLPIGCPQIEMGQSFPNRGEVCGRLAFYVQISWEEATARLKEKKTRKAELKKLINLKDAE